MSSHSYLIRGDLVEAPFLFEAKYLFSYGEFSRFFKEIIENQRLMGTECPNCGNVWLPPRPHCPECYADTRWIEMPTEGVLEEVSYSYYVSPGSELLNYTDLPYVLGLVRIGRSATCLTSIVNVDSKKLNTVSRGDRVKVCFREKLEGKITDLYLLPIKGE